MRRCGWLCCVSLALVLQACGGRSSDGRSRDAPGNPTGAGPSSDQIDPPAQGTPGETPDEAAPTEAPSADGALYCAELFPTELPPPVEFTAEVLAHHSRCGPGLTDGQANYVALTAFGDVVGSRLYDFLPMAGGDAMPNLVGGLYPKSTVFGELKPQPHGYHWQWDGSGMSAPHTGPLQIYDEQGAHVSDADLLGRAWQVFPVPGGGSVATTVESAYVADGAPQTRWRLERLDEAGRRLATYDEGWKAYQRYSPLEIIAVNRAGNVLVQRDEGTTVWVDGKLTRPTHFRWLDGELRPLTDWFPAPEYVLKALALADGSVALRPSSPNSWLILKDRATTLAPAPDWLVRRNYYDEISLIREGRAYAVVLGQSYGDPYPALVEVLTAAGESCGTFTLPASPCARYSVAQDGTVFASWASVQDEESCTITVDQLFCTWRWWPKLLGDR